jgi:hypothetical protein
MASVTNSLSARNVAGSFALRLPSGPPAVVNLRSNINVLRQIPCREAAANSPCPGSECLASAQGIDPAWQAITLNRSPIPASRLRALVRADIGST